MRHHKKPNQVCQFSSELFSYTAKYNFSAVKCYLLFTRQWVWPGFVVAGTADGASHLSATGQCRQCSSSVAARCPAQRHVQRSVHGDPHHRQGGPRRCRRSAARPRRQPDATHQGSNQPQLHGQLINYCCIDKIHRKATRGKGKGKGWWLGVAVTRFIRSTKLLYAGPG